MSQASSRDCLAAAANTSIARSSIGPSSVKPSAIAPSPCQSCGACCAFSADWPRFSTETDEALDLIPTELVDPSLSGMAWTGTRCRALSGRVGELTACTIYDLRPEVCRACQPGDDACTIARAHHGMPALAASVSEIEVC